MTWEWFQWSGTPHSPKLQNWSLTHRQFNVIIRALAGGVLHHCRDEVGVLYSLSLLGWLKRQRFVNVFPKNITLQKLLIVANSKCFIKFLVNDGINIHNMCIFVLWMMTRYLKIHNSLVSCNTKLLWRERHSDARLHIIQGCKSIIRTLTM